MLLTDTPAWSKKKLARLGRALAEGSDAPENCPAYDDVMFWHHELAATVADEVASRRWESSAGIELGVSSRGKTIDTLIQKLRRPPLIPLDQVQDLAGVRVDADMTSVSRLHSRTNSQRTTGSKNVVTGIFETTHTAATAPTTYGCGYLLGALKSRSERKARASGRTPTNAWGTHSVAASDTTKSRVTRRSFKSSRECTQCPRSSLESKLNETS